MLALKALLAHRMELPTIIFDEIDTGVSGRIADAMGEIIADLSQTMQVVDITTCRRSLRKATLTSWFTKTPKDPISAASTRRSGLPKSPKCYRAAKSRKPHSHRLVSCSNHKHPSHKRIHET